MLLFARAMKKEDLKQKRVCDNGPDHHKAAAHPTRAHSVLNNSQNYSSSLQKELFYFNTRNCSLFNTIPLPSVGKEMALSLSESAGRNSSAAAPWKDSFHLHFSSEKDSLNRVSHCINSISVMAWLQEACSFAGDSFVFFAHFWLGNLRNNKKLQFLELEMSSSKEDEPQLAFPKELEPGGLPNLCSIPVASQHEYALGLSSNQKPCIFLCYLNLISSEQTLGYKKMLSNIQYVTNNFHIIQLVISVLAFALAGLWYAVVKTTEPLILREEPHSIELSGKQLVAYENVNIPDQHTYLNTRTRISTCGRCKNKSRTKCWNDAVLFHHALSQSFEINPVSCSRISYLTLWNW